ncbi:MAG: hypothetical protein QM756_44465 [Polyangiaceae bacterium]
METQSNSSEKSDVLQTIAQLRDEIRLKVHLAGLDARERWQEFEEQVKSLEFRIASEGEQMAGATEALARDLKQSLSDFRERLAH